jgi:hypothetical protein
VPGVVDADHNEHGHTPAAPVVNDHDTGATITFPDKSFTPDTVAVNTVDAANAALGVNTNPDVEYDTVPPTTVDPGPVNVNDPDPDCTASSNDTDGATPTDTPDAPDTGLVDTTDGAVTSDDPNPNTTSTQ